jgi:hypothetical protein
MGNSSSKAQQGNKGLSATDCLTQTNSRPHSAQLCCTVLKAQLLLQAAQLQNVLLRLRAVQTLGANHGHG